MPLYRASLSDGAAVEYAFADIDAANDEETLARASDWAATVVSPRTTKTSQQPSPQARRDYLLRAQAYAQAALRDFQHYHGRAAADEAKAQGLLDQIVRLLQTLE